jgi:hypothetical protein
MAEEQVEEKKVSAVMVLVVKHRSDVLPWVGWLIFPAMSVVGLPKRRHARRKGSFLPRLVHSLPYLFVVGHQFHFDCHGGKIRQRK